MLHSLANTYTISSALGWRGGREIYFMAAYIISLCVVNPVITTKPRFGRTMVYTSSFIISAILTIEEFTSIVGASEHFDIYDIIASVLGSTLAILTYELINYRQKNRLRKIDTK